MNENRLARLKAAVAELDDDERDALTEYLLDTGPSVTPEELEEELERERGEGEPCSQPHRVSLGREE